MKTITTITLIFLLFFSTYAQNKGNDCSTAIDYEINSDPIAGYMVSPDTWWYTFTLYADYTDVLISTCNSGTSTNELTLYSNCSGDIVANGEMCDQAQGNYNEKIELSNLPQGTYYVSVEGPTGPGTTGAYSFEIIGTTTAPNDDMGITNIAKPVKNFNNVMPVSVTIENFGINSQTGFPVSYTFMGNTITETYTGTISPGESAQYTFIQTIDLATESTYSITAKTELVGDENPVNDEFLTQINTYVNPNALFFIYDDYAVVPDNPAFDFTDNFTIEAWFYPHSTKMVGKLVSKHGNDGTRSGYALEYDGSNIRAVIGIGGSWAVVSSSAPFDQWHHVAMVYSSGTLEMYLDGVSQGTASGIILSNDLDLYIGASQQYGDNWTGYIDELRIWNDARTEAEILDNMNTEINPQSENLLAYYDFNRGIPEGDNTAIGTLPDMTNNNFHADMYNFALQAGLADGNFFEDCNLDLTAPVPDVANIDVTEECSVDLSTYSPTATDNCAGTINGTTTDPLTYTEQGTYTVTWTYTDGNGNIATQNQTVIVEDITNPTVTCPGNQTINLNEGETFYTVQADEFDPTETTDNCGIAEVINDFNSSSTLENEEFTAGTYTLTWTVSDEAGNENSCSFELTVNDYVGITDIASEISIYPNPTNGIVNFDFSNLEVKKISISDLTGKVIIEKTVTNKLENIDFSNYSNGVYLIKLQTDKEILTTKIIKDLKSAS